MDSLEINFVLPDGTIIACWREQTGSAEELILPTDKKGRRILYGDAQHVNFLLPFLSSSLGNIQGRQREHATT